MEFQTDDLALPAGELGHGGSHRGTAERHVRLVLAGGRACGRVLGIDHELRAPAPVAKLVQGGVAGDAEKPSSLLASPAIECPPAPVGAFERQGRDVFCGGLVSEQGHHVCVHVTSA